MLKALGKDPLLNGLSAGYTALLVTVCVALYALAVVAFGSGNIGR